MTDSKKNLLFNFINTTVIYESIKRFQFVAIST